MNLVSKEYVIAASTSSNPGMLVLSQFAGSATDLTQALIINPYDVEQTADAIHQALTMSIQERKTRISQMAVTLEEHNVYSWVMQFLQAAENAARENRKVSI
jgi:trehalose 6-phosphate synthase